MPPDPELARRTPAGIQVRPDPIRLKWDLADLTTSDGHIARAIFTTAARALPDTTELRMLDEALLGSRTILTTADVIAYFAEPLLAAAKKYAATAEAHSLLADDGRRGLLAALIESARSIAFACGIEILQPQQIDIDCPTLARQRFEENERQSAQRRAAGQVDALRRSAELFAQFQSLRAAAPDLTAGQALAQIGAADQADVFRAAVRASAPSAANATLWAVAGNSLIRVPREEAGNPELIEVPTDLGPIRSIRPAPDGQLLLGCRSGILLLNPVSPAAATRFIDADSTSQLGFNAAMIQNNTLFASHTESGFLSWNLSAPEKPASALRTLSTRNLTPLDSTRLLLTTGSRLLIHAENTDLKSIETNSEIIAVFPQPHRILTLHADGDLCAWSRDDFALQSRQRRAGRICAAALFPFLNDARILLAPEDGPLLCVGPDDDIVTQYSSAYSAPRILTATADLIAAATPDRQRLLLWNPWDGKKPCRDLYIYGQAKHRITDIALI